MSYSSNRAILIIDDDPFTLRQMERLLTRSGLNRIISVNRAQAALDRLSDTNEECYLLITDLNMPGLSGRELIEQINSHYSVLCLILISGEAPADLTQLSNNCQHNGNHLIGFIKKPVQKDKLMSLIQRASDISGL